MQSFANFVKRIDELLQKNGLEKKLEEDQQYLQQLPKSFIQFLKSREIPIDELITPIPRYIRLKPSSLVSEEELLQSLKISKQQILKVEQSFYALAPDCKINTSTLYKDSILYGMDYSSAIPIKCLQVQQGQKVLELCSSPGNKSMYLADCVKQIQITGVEISQNRANVMKNLIKKYGLENKINVIVEDGINFDSQFMFDRVLIDAECTHQGSIKHIKKFFQKHPQTKKQSKVGVKQKKKLTAQQQKQYSINNRNPYTSEIKKINQWSIEDFEERFLDKKKIDSLKSLQMGLLRNGFRLLKQGGILIYSTCSFDQEQNQQIVRNFIEKEPSAEILDSRQNLVCSVPYFSGKVKGTIKFSPSVSRSGGMFIAKIKKSKVD